MADEIVLSERDIRNFWRHVTVGERDECWIWRGGSPGNSGYGAFCTGGRQYVATHIALILSGHPRPKNAAHRNALHGDCSNPACVNPRHLRWGTHIENMRDRARLNRFNPARGEAHSGSKISEAVVRDIRSADRKAITGRELARKHGISPALVSLIRSRKVWRHIP